MDIEGAIEVGSGVWCVGGMEAVHETNVEVGDDLIDVRIHGSRLLTPGVTEK